MQGNKKDTEKQLRLLQKGYWEAQAQGGMAATFDLTAFLVSMIAPVKKSVNHLRTIASMRKTRTPRVKRSLFRRHFCSWSLFDSIIFLLPLQYFLWPALRQSGLREWRANFVSDKRQVSGWYFPAERGEFHISRSLSCGKILQAAFILLWKF